MGEITTNVPPSQPERSIFITHHAPDMESIKITQFEHIAKELKDMGFSKHRFDIRWKSVMPTSKRIEESYLGKSALLAQAAHKQGLEPIVILSTPPEWAYKRKSPDQIRQAFRVYAKSVKRHFDRLHIPITSIQILNELNNPVYTPKKLLTSFPDLIHETKDIFGQETDISATVVLSKPWTNAARFLEKHHDQLKDVTSIGLDFYPGSYQYNKHILSPKNSATIARQSLEAIASKGKNPVRRDFLALLKEQLTDISEFSRVLTQTKSLFPNAHIDIGEFGFPTLDPIQKRNPDHEKLQSYAVEKIATAITPVINEHKVRNIGFYELFDDKELGILNWGIINDKGEAKQILNRLPSIITKLRNTQSSIGADMEIPTTSSGS